MSLKNVVANKWLNELQRVSAILNVIRLNTETNLLTGASLQADISCKLFFPYFQLTD